MSAYVYKRMIGKVMSSIEKIGDNELIFHCMDGGGFKFYHEQDCCEYVAIEDIDGDVNDLVGYPLLVAECVSSQTSEDYSSLSITWTFYKFATVKGSVTVRWCGSSNGYYSESVDFCEIE